MYHLWLPSHENAERDLLTKIKDQIERAVLIPALSVEIQGITKTRVRIKIAKSKWDEEILVEEVEDSFVATKVEISTKTTNISVK